MPRERGERTLLISVLLSAPGPIILAVGLLRGRAATQLADLVRRTVELGALVVSYAVYRRTSRSLSCERERLERIAGIIVGAAMCVSGGLIALITLCVPVNRSGSVGVGLSIAILGAVTNGWFWIRYSRLNRADANRIIDTQRRLYRAKTFVDLGVTVALMADAIRLDSPLVRWIDTGGSIAVAAYMLATGVQAICATVR